MLILWGIIAGLLVVIGLIILLHDRNIINISIIDDFILWTKKNRISTLQIGLVCIVVSIIIIALFFLTT